MTTLSPPRSPSEPATTFSPSLVEARKPISSGSAPTSFANWARTVSVLCSMSPREMGALAFDSANSRPAATTGSGVGVMYAEFRKSPRSVTGKSARTPRGSLVDPASLARPGVTAESPATEGKAARTDRRVWCMKDIMQSVVEGPCLPALRAAC